MLSSKIQQRILGILLILAVGISFVYMYGEEIGIKNIASTPEYEQMLFDTSKVHSIHIKMENWNTFLENAMEEEYVPCNIEINGELFANVGIRVKGNNSKRLTHEYGLQ